MDRIVDSATSPQLLQTVLDCTDPRLLAEFYRRLLGLEYRPGDEPSGEVPDADWLVLVGRTAGGGWRSSRSTSCPRRRGRSRVSRSRCTWT